MDKIVITGGKPLRGTVRVSGSKNATLPLMAAALLADSPTVLRGVPDLRDIRTMVGVIESLGASVQFDDGVMVIDPANFANTEAPYDMVRKMRASIYVMGPMLARLRAARVSMPGGCAIGPRPVDLHLKGFEYLGAKIDLDAGYVIANTDQLKGAEFNLSGAAGSSVGATCNVLMAATLAQGRTIIHGAAREPDVIELADFLAAMGAQISGAGTRTIIVDGVEHLRGMDHQVLPDRIEAGTFVTAAAIVESEVIIDGAPVNHMQATLDKAEEIGAEIRVAGSRITVRGRPGHYEPTNIVTETYPGFATDMQAQFMAVLATVRGESFIREGIYPNRFMHVPELARMGARIKVLGDTARVEGVEFLTGAPVMASDLRASAALVVAGLAARGTTIVNRVYHIDRGYEHLDAKLRGLGADVRRFSSDGNETPLPEELGASG
jgi:UDP-N-acetylglucosamine 1-carboxyvinyltransferase